MPKIRWDDLPDNLMRHLIERVKDRQITLEDLFALKEWKRYSPDAPEGEWYKDFGTFKLCGEGQYPKTFLLADKMREARNWSRFVLARRERTEGRRRQKSRWVPVDFAAPCSIYL